MAIEPAEYKILLVSGFHNKTPIVDEPHETLAGTWRGRGFEVARIDPDWPDGDFRSTFDEITAETRSGLDGGKKLIRVGSSAGGSTVAATRTEIEPDAPVRDITICSRFDFDTNANSPDRSMLQELSPLLVESIDHILTNRRLLNIRPDTVLAMTAGNRDTRVPRSSSMPHGARYFGIGGGHDHPEAVLYALAHHGDTMLTFGTTPRVRRFKQ